MQFRFSVIRMLLISQGCAVAEHTFYCKIITNDKAIRSGMYCFNADTNIPQIFMPLIWRSDKVWRQGPRGGVKIFKNRNYGYYGYVTNSSEEMKEFIWVKLQAQSIN
jgi:hypothetical protein